MLRSAFSLIELLIVVVIVGIVYTLALPNFDLLKRYETKELSLENLRDFLQNIPHEKTLSLFCIDACHECFILRDGEQLKEQDNLFKGFIDESVEFYTYNPLRGMEKKELGVYLMDAHNAEQLCFAYTINNALQGSELYIAYKDRVYDYTSAFETKTYASLQEAIEAKKNFEREVLE